MTRQEVRVSLSAADQRRVARIAARYGWSGFALTVWALAQELDGVPVDAALAMAELVARVVASPAHDPTVRVSGDGTRFTLAVGPVDTPKLVPPVPGKATATLIVPDPNPPLAPPNQLELT